MDDDDYEAPPRRSDDDRRRVRDVESGGLAIARALKVHGHVELTPELEADAQRSIAQRSKEMHAAAAVVQLPSFEERRTMMLGFGWPLRAIEHAAHAYDTSALQRIRAWSHRKEAIVLAGPKGTGKTVAAAWAAMNWHRPTTFRFARAATLIRLGRFDQKDRPRIEPWPERWADVVAAPALCIDDLGAEYLDVKGSFVSDFDELLDTFYSCRRPLIITTNADGATLRERYGTRVLDRITECATWAACEGPSLRVHDNPLPWENE